MADAAYGMLCDKILKFELVPGLVVSDHTLSQALNMSRTPIREALVRLEQDGLIEFDNNNKMVITHASIRDVEEIAQARIAIECRAVDLIFSRNGLTGEEKEAMHQLHATLVSHVANGELHESYTADDAFHMAPVAFCGNTLLLKFFRLMRNQMMRTRYVTTILNPDWFKNTSDQHDHLLEIWLQGNPDAIKNSLVEHLNSFSSYINELVRKNPQFKSLPNLAMFFQH